MMTEQNRLCPLQMRIAGHDNVTVFFSGLDNGFLQFDKEFGNCRNFPANVHMRIQCNLVVAAAPGMKPFAGFTDSICQPFFHIHVNVFQFYRKFKFAFFNLFINMFQPCDNGIFISFRNNALPLQHRRVGNAAANIFCIHAAVKLDRGIEFFYTFIRGLCKAAAP